MAWPGGLDRFSAHFIAFKEQLRTEGPPSAVGLDQLLDVCLEHPVTGKSHVAMDIFPGYRWFSQL